MYLTQWCMQNISFGGALENLGSAQTSSTWRRPKGVDVNCKYTRCMLCFCSSKHRIETIQAQKVRLCHRTPNQWFLPLQHLQKNPNLFKPIFKSSYFEILWKIPRKTEPIWILSEFFDMRKILIRCLHYKIFSGQLAYKIWSCELGFNLRRI